MKKITILLLLVALSLRFFAISDEGMWLLNKISQLNYGDMQKLGLKLTAEEIYSINNSSLKDAIFQLQTENGSGFCTGEIVSNQGLLFTNHHCGYEAITKLSSVENNYLDNGYWAKSYEEEIYCPGIRVTRVVRIEDVTSKVLAEVTDKMSEEERNKKISKAIKDIEKEAVKDTHYEASVSEMFQGSEYYLFVYEAFGDVRFVGAPPSSIGKFGGDTDNWMWPRHTGDFSVFRVYMSPDGKPTKSYSKDNVPYQPLHYLPISIAGVEQGDFTMIMGYPGQTERYLSSYGMIYKRDYFNPTVVALLDKHMSTLKQDMDADINVRLAYADSYASGMNGHKLFKGEALTLRTTDAIQQKEKLEADFRIWVNADPENRKKYSDALDNLKQLYEAFGPATNDIIYLSLGLLQGGQQVMKVQQFSGLKRLLEDPKKNSEMIKSTIESMRPDIDGMFDKYFPATDRKVFTAMLKMYIKDVPAEKRNKVFNDYIFKTFKGKTEEESIDKFIYAVFTKSIFTDKARMEAFLAKPTLKALSSDPLNAFVENVFGDILNVQTAYVNTSKQIDVNERIFIQGLREFQTERKFYPDANSTLRLTYGTVQPYYPRDAVYYHYLTYAEGILEKEDPSNDEFIVPVELKEKVLAKDYGRYADKTGRLPVCFLSNNDITGGNSGSPIINGKGELIGLAFDGNWEWLCSNLIYSPELQRTINVDARYVLWVIDKLYNCQHIMKELDVRK